MGKGIMALREKQRTLTLDVTGNVAWRRQGIFYKKNELFLDTVEKVSALLTPAGDMLAGEVSGRIVMKSQLSGMPECKLGLNVGISMLSTISDKPWDKPPIKVTFSIPMFTS